MDSPVDNAEIVKREEVSGFELFAELKLKIEALLFSAETALEVSELRNFLGEVSLSEVRLALKELARDYENRAIALCEFGGKYQIRTKDQYADLVRRQFMSKPKGLSKSALETLAIVAYRQPVTRAEINTIRNVDSSSIVQTLKDRDLIYISGTRKDVGSPLEFKTTPKFLEVFGLSSLEQLPSLRSLQMSQDSRDEVKNALDALDGNEEELPSSEELTFPDDGAGADANAADGEGNEPLLVVPLHDDSERAGATATTLFEKDAGDNFDPFAGRAGAEAALEALPTLSMVSEDAWFDEEASSANPVPAALEAGEELVETEPSAVEDEQSEDKPAAAEDASEAAAQSSDDNGMKP